MDELIMNLKKLHEEEMADSKKYQELSTICKSKGMDKAAGILKDISEEEVTHAKMLAFILLKEDVKV